MKIFKIALFLSRCILKVHLLKLAVKIFAILLKADFCNHILVATYPKLLVLRIFAKRHLGRLVLGRREELKEGVFVDLKDFGFSEGGFCIFHFY